MNKTLRLAGLTLIALSAGCASTKNTDDVSKMHLEAIASNQRESIDLLKQVLAEQIRHNKVFEATYLSSKDTKKEEPKKEEKRLPPEKKKG